MPSAPKLNRRLPIPGHSPVEELNLATFAALLSELTVVRQRLDTVERLLDRKQLVPLADIEHFEPTPSEVKARDQLRGTMIAKVMEPVREAFEREVDGLTES